VSLTAAIPTTNQVDSVSEARVALNKIGLDRIEESFRSQLLAVDGSLKLPF